MGRCLVDRADDVPGDRTEHLWISPFFLVNAFGDPSEGSPTWINFTKVACFNGSSKRKTDALVYVGAAVIPTPSPGESPFHPVLLDLVRAGIREHDRDQRKPHRTRLGFNQSPSDGVHGNPVELLVERGQEPDDNKIVTLAQHV